MRNKSEGLQRKESPRIIFQPDVVTLCTGQCDCACANMSFSEREASSAFLPDTSSLVAAQFGEYALNAGYSAVHAPSAQGVSVLNQSALELLRRFDEPATLRESALFWNKVWPAETVHSSLKQMLALGLLTSPEAKARPIAENPTTLAAWLHVTDRCNLRCAYCYLPHHQTDMTLDTGKAAIAATARSAQKHGYRALKFKYAGGEPLLRFPLLKELHGEARRLAQQHELELDGVVLSNGTLLTHEMVEDMQALGLRLMISLDNLAGPGQRVYPDGRDAAGDAMRAVELALASGITPDISITVSGRTVHALPQLLAWVLKRDLPFSLNFYREPATLNREACEDLQLRDAHFIEGMLAAYKFIEANLPRRSLLASLVDMANFAAPHLRRCSVGHSYLVVDPRGRVAKCQMQLDRPVTTVRADDPLALVRADLQGIQNMEVDKKDECRTCRWKYWCAGGCPLETYRESGRYDVKSPHCAIYKALYPEVLRLEGLRLLKYAQDYERKDDVEQQ